MPEMSGKCQSNPPPLKNPYIRPCGKTGFDHVSKNTILKEKSWNRSNTSLQ